MLLSLCRSFLHLCFAETCRCTTVPPRQFLRSTCSASSIRSTVPAKRCVSNNSRALTLMTLMASCKSLLTATCGQRWCADTTILKMVITFDDHYGIKVSIFNSLCFTLNPDEKLWKFYFSRWIYMEKIKIMFHHSSSFCLFLLKHAHRKVKLYMSCTLLLLQYIHNISLWDEY